MVIAALIALAVLLLVAGVSRFGADSRDGRDWTPTDDIDRSHPWVAGFHSGDHRAPDLATLRLPTELGGCRPMEDPWSRS
ncbi:hypothetical protein [Pseudofrankia asymbiotica]|uniref:Uncharacterized protein n=1 Tax=Pseudofrankia asymbiotica TaxID=1834516 RepID=A0A1V2I5Q4_9ACTN|nr:hypothetical protein [Pseudofrankia asymbiotica]ONH26136.1 hypothetical protein BL253_25685 [Pseudofrankia asymbiotica]